MQMLIVYSKYKLNGLAVPLLLGRGGCMCTEIKYCPNGDQNTVRNMKTVEGYRFRKRRSWLTGSHETRGKNDMLGNKV